MAKAGSTEKVVREIRRHTRRRCSAEEKIRIVLEGLRGVWPPDPIVLAGADEEELPLAMELIEALVIE